MFIVMAISYIILQNNQAKTADLPPMTERHKVLTTEMFFCTIDVKMNYIVKLCVDRSFCVEQAESL